MRLYARHSLAIALAVLASIATPVLAEVTVDIVYAADAAKASSTIGPKALTQGPGLVVPFFANDKNDGNGPTTLYSVRNNSDGQIVVRISYQPADGGPTSLLQEKVMGGHSVHAVNTRLLNALPVDDDGFTRGFIVIEALGNNLPSGVISGEVFHVDASNAAANGGALPNADLADCKTWSHRFLQGGEFDGGTTVYFLSLDAPVAGPTLIGNVYNEAGVLQNTVELTSDQELFSMSTDDLNLPVSFGSIEWVFQGNGHGIVSTNFSASGLFSVGAEGACVDDINPDPDPEPTGIAFEIPGTFHNCRNCGPYRYDMPLPKRMDLSKVVVDFDVFIAAWDPERTSGYHNIFWLNNGPKWQDMMGYLNARGTRNFVSFAVNGPFGNPIGIETQSRPGLELGKEYHVHYEYDTVERVVSFEIYTPSGALWTADYIDIPGPATPVSSGKMFIEFGGYRGEGPESLTVNWRFSNFKALFVPVE